MLKPSVSANDLKVKNEVIENEKYGSLNAAFNNIETKLKNKMDQMKQAIASGEVVAKVKMTKPLRENDLKELQDAYHGSGFSVEMKREEELQDYTGQHNRFGNYIPAEYDTVYVLTVRMI